MSLPRDAAKELGAASVLGHCASVVEPCLAFQKSVLHLCSCWYNFDIFLVEKP